MLRLSPSLVKRLEEAARKFSYRTGNQVAADVIERCLPIWERGESEKAKVFEQYLIQGAQGTTSNPLDEMQVLKSEISTPVGTETSTELPPQTSGKKGSTTRRRGNR